MPGDFDALVEQTFWPEILRRLNMVTFVRLLIDEDGLSGQRLLSGQLLGTTRHHRCPWVLALLGY